MEAIRFIIKYFFKLALGFFFFALVWWLVALLFPTLSYSSIKQSFAGDGDGAGKDWLPPPRNYSGLLKNKGAQNEYTNVYVHGAPYNGYALSDNNYSYSTTNFVTYTGTGTIITGLHGEKVTEPVKVTPPTTPTTSSTTKPSQASPKTTKNLYIRNLSIYEGGHIYTNLSFIGEARSEFFNNGKFPIVMVDNVGKVIGVSIAQATTKWSIPGWVRFETKIQYPLPNNAPCTMVFEEALLDSEKTRKPVRVALPIRCN